MKTAKPRVFQVRDDAGAALWVCSDGELEVIAANAFLAVRAFLRHRRAGGGPKRIGHGCRWPSPPRSAP